jgi:hypothetical protein
MVKTMESEPTVQLFSSRKGYRGDQKGRITALPAPIGK